MASSVFCEYDKKYPNLVMEILDYFSLNNEKTKPIKERSILKFCQFHKDNFNVTYQPWIISAICKRLCENGQMLCLKSFGSMGMDENYLFAVNYPELFEKKKAQLQYYYNSMIYGFEYIYELYKNIVVPLVWEKKNGDYSAGTGFKFADGIATAKHCITDAENLQVKGYSAKELANSAVYISDNEGVDIAFIKTGRVEEPLIYCDEGKILQEVLVMGYPKVPAFTAFLTSEKASISGKAEARITPTKGCITAYANEYLAKIEAMLITAKIRGGNSGGPVINQNGCLVGIACQLPNYYGEIGDYDDLGYGVAVPSKYLKEIVFSENPPIYRVPDNFWRNFEE